MLGRSNRYHSSASRAVRHRFPSCGDDHQLHPRGGGLLAAATIRNPTPTPQAPTKLVGTWYCAPEATPLQPLSPLLLADGI